MRRMNITLVNIVRMGIMPQQRPELSECLHSEICPSLFAVTQTVEIFTFITPSAPGWLVQLFRLVFH